MLLVVVLVVVEGFVNVWWYQVNVCAFEKNEIFEDLDDEAKRQLCLENFELQYTPEGIEPNQRGESININNEGFRGPEITKEKPENTYRIFVVGGSTTFGSGVKDDETAPAHLQKIFDSEELDFKVEVINAGIPAGRSTGEVIFVKEKLMEYDPDLFIIYDGVNDLKEVTQTGAIPWKDRWLEICNMGKDHGFDTIITIQPFLGTGTRTPTDQEFPFIEYGISDIMKPYSLFMEQFEELNTSCTLTANFTVIFDKVEETIFFDFAHVNSKGNEIVAENWYKISLPVILDKASEITSESDKILNRNVETDSKSSSISSNSVLDDSINTFRKLLLSYKTPRVMLHLPSVFENNIFQQNLGFDHTKGGTDYILSGKTSCEALGGVWNNVQYCSVSNLTIKVNDTVLIKKYAVLKILDKLVNYGTIIIDRGFIIYVHSELINQEGTIFINRTSAIRGLNSTLSNNGGNITINNDGSLVNQGGIVNNNFDSIITNKFGGFITNFKGGVMNNNGDAIINNAGLIYNAANSVFNNNGGTIINNAGMINTEANSVFNNNDDGNIENTNGGVITSDAGTTFNNQTRKT